ncbi:hypothetical protein [Microbacterium sp. bgisy203]|uniref:hypothetical protein n=1 Tax=Microbacterium sp. bgisy203 TaxID=3413799 RepID=UPI003D71501E
MDAAEGWHDFDVAMVGATSALAGLVIVAASVNIGYIVKVPSLTSRLGSGIAGLVLALTASAVGLFPGISSLAYGVTVAVAAVLALVFPVEATRRVYQNPDHTHRARPVKAGVGFVAPLAYLVGAVLLIAGAPSGYVLFAAGSILAIIAALIISWVVLVEVLR